ncbi:carbohydrate ABC transporter permease [Fictibacillus enclensis]|uniref:carbohydrate ABC transporter permease n=1 Tax=Fictibacillus enclensis TaxID=1017270 RepID=UPI0024BF189A|nr:sugar ABC transporter permease [Fictibacillus enclensis]WHY74535.1 sugar ABC transporter permease [Fictibacillus enclensis]
MEVTTTTSSSYTPAVAKNKKPWKKTLLPWLMLTPALLLLLLVVGGPIAGTLLLSFTNWDGIGSADFIGLQNFVQLIQDKRFYAAMFNNAKWMVFFLTVPVFIGLGIALLVSKVKFGQTFYRVMVFLPYIIATVVTAKIWLGIYNPYVGINVLLKNWGLESLALSWLGDGKIALLAVAVADGWHFFGFLVVLFLIALQQLDKSLEEAAKVEGANKIQIFWHVTLPQLRPTLALVYMLLIIWSFAAFDYVFVMTQGGPGDASELLATYMYKLAIYGQQPGYASAVALTMGIFSLLVILGFGSLKKKGWDV